MTKILSTYIQMPDNNYNTIEMFMKHDNKYKIFHGNSVAAALVVGCLFGDFLFSTKIRGPFWL